jgi:ferredoxin-NADP reductase
MHTTTLKNKRDVASGTMEFEFERPEGFSYAAGQTVDITLVNPPETDAEGNTRTFSLVSYPEEPSLKIATRIRDTAFKRTLSKMESGTALSFDGPFGSFTLHENAARPAILLAGGIGITPFHSIIADATARKLPHKIVLFYSNRRPEDTAFLDELKGFAQANPNFSLVATMTQMDQSSEAWDGEQGYIDAAMLSRHVPGGTLPVYYLAGPPAMVAALRDMLKASGVSGDDIKFEDFAGY